MTKRHELRTDGVNVQGRFGAVVRARRRRLGISQEELAWRAGLHRSYIADIERGGRNITLRSIAGLAQALQVPMASLLSEAHDTIGVPAAPSAAETGPPHAAKPLGEVLLVEDSAEDAKLTLRAFADARFTNPICVARDGAEALDYLFGLGAFVDRAEAPPPQVVLLDINLPRVHGLEVLRRMKADVRTRDVPVVVLTVSDDDNIMAECRRLGVDTYIVKPVGFENFRKVASRLSLQWALLPAGRSASSRSPRPSPQPTG